MISQLRHRLLRTDARLRAAYLDGPRPHGLHLGCGGRPLPGWLNTDLERHAGVAVMDATRPFPFADGVFDHVYSEHMIEHLTWADARAMLAECRRVLRPGGILRIVTPDLAVLAGLCRPDRDETAARYVDYVLRTFADPGEPATVATLLNTFFRSWGHTYLFDAPTLASTLEAAGFTGIEAVGLQESRYEHLRGLAHDTRYPEGLLAFESMTFEATRP